MEFDFAANRTVDALEVVPEQFRSAYVQTEGGYTIAPTHAPFVDLVVGLNGSLKASRTEAKTLKSKAIDLSALSEFGGTPEEIKATFDAQVADLNDKLAKGVKIDPEKIKADLAKGFKSEIDAKDSQLAAMSTTLQRYLIQGEATRAIAASKGIPDLLLPHIQSQVKVVQNGNDYEVVVVDKDGDKRISGKTGKDMTIADLVEEMKASPTFGRAFESDAPSGGGARPQATSRGSQAASASGAGGGAAMTPLQKIQAGLEQRSR